MEPLDGAGDAMLSQAVQAALQAGHARVRLLQLPDGRRFWLKEVERLSGRLRLQKGDPSVSFTRELKGLQQMQAMDLPVARLALQGPGWFVLEDAGPALVALIQATDVSLAEKLGAMRAAGAALAKLHAAGQVHGRPAVRDMCWDGAQLRFIDLERFGPGRRGGYRQAMDLMIMAQSAFVRWPEAPEWIEAAFAGYRAAGGSVQVFQRMGRLAWILSPLGALARGLLRLRRTSRELRAIALVLPWLRREVKRLA
ncbi:hypothetical protein Q9295_06210 [Xinfangfangia sp. CPCC 101601]|uniref:Serine/threonine protein phosphatase n=1 Tax=Pseudogemmobacter lacusdianii TaxID=3069608 RepID=A0ABU0VW29_9RHOB|nr:hypothetical protein [Xinfangfangia sp. CPCC 101601]MDQ2065957.1 hypothetical protein [Xinfangfangia sp. CPCC 101601]